MNQLPIGQYHILNKNLETNDWRKNISSLAAICYHRLLCRVLQLDGVVTYQLSGELISFIASHDLVLLKTYMLAI